MDIIRRFRFESAHYLPNVPKGHKCGRLHGHSYEASVTVRGDVNQVSGWVVDFADISTAWVVAGLGVLDHNYLNEIAGLENPTSENLAMFIWGKMAPLLGGQLRAVSVSESCTSSVTYHGPA